MKCYYLQKKIGLAFFLSVLEFFLKQKKKGKEEKCDNKFMA